MISRRGILGLFGIAAVAPVLPKVEPETVVDEIYEWKEISGPTYQAYSGFESLTADYAAKLSKVVTNHNALLSHLKAKGKLVEVDNIEDDDWDDEEYDDA